jgi:hypothetical protein
LGNTGLPALLYAFSIRTIRQIIFNKTMLFCFKQLTCFKYFTCILDQQSGLSYELSVAVGEYSICITTDGPVLGFAAMHL